MAINQQIKDALLEIFDEDDLRKLEDDLESDGVDNLTEKQKKQYNIIEKILQRVGKGEDVREVLRQTIHEKIQSAYQDKEVFSQRDFHQQAKNKRKELIDILNNIDDHIHGKSIPEVTAFFSSLMDIISQLCVLKTDGIIVVSTRLFYFFKYDDPSHVPPAFKQEINLIFAPEEITAFQMKLPLMEDTDPFKRLFVTIIDQAYDMSRFNELSGQLLIFMTQYFIDRLKKEGHHDEVKVLEYNQRYVRSKAGMEKAVEELRDIEVLINQHLAKNPILNEFPKYLRALIQIKIGLIDAQYAPKILKSIKLKSGEYSKVRKNVALDFVKLPETQHTLHLRHGIVLNLQKDVLAYAMKLLEEEFQSVEEELKRLMEDIETASEKLDPSSPDYQQKLEKKGKLQKKLEETRKEMDVVRSQFRLVDIQHKLVQRAIKRYREREGQTKVEIQSPVKKISSSPSLPIKKTAPNRMFTAKKRK